MLMKSNFILSILFFFPFALLSQDYLNESFESGALPVGWTVEQMGSFGGATWTVTNNATPGANTGNYYIAFDDADASAMGLITPAMDISGASNPYLTLYYYIPTGGDYIRTISYKTSQYGAWTELVGSTFEVTNQWVEVTVELPETSSSFYIGINGMINGLSGLYLDDIRVYNLLDLPESTTAVYPQNEQDSVVYSHNHFVWNTPVGSPTTYKLYLGTDGAGTQTPVNMVNGEELADTVYSYTALAPGTTYFWQVVPSNDNGDAQNCPIWSFTTLPGDTINTFPYEQTFDADTIPGRWVNVLGESSKDYSITNWSSWGAVGDHTGGGNYAFVDASLPNEMEVNMVSPVFDLSVLDAPKMSFWYNIADAGAGATTIFVDVYNGVWNNAIKVIDADADFTEEWVRTEVSLSNYSSDYTFIRIRSSLGFGQISDVKIDDFSIYNGISCPVEYAPEDNTTLHQLSGSLSWSEVENANGYILYFGTDGDGQELPVNIEDSLIISGNDTSYSFSGLSFDETYYWSVIPFNELESGEACVINTFSLSNPAECPVLSYPQNSASGVALDDSLFWQDVYSAEGYIVYLGTDGAGTDIPTNVLDSVVVQGVEYLALPALQPQTTYYWTVKSYAGAYISENCDIYSFTTDVSNNILKAVDADTKIYPNPAKNILHIKSNKQINKIKVFDICGNKIAEYQKENIKHVNLDKYNTGIYFISLYNSENKIVKKLVVE